MIDFKLPVPLFLLRRIVRRIPWLLAENGAVNRPVLLDLGLCEIELDAAISLQPKQRAR